MHKLHSNRETPFHIAGKSDTGKSREQNEDAFGTFTLLVGDGEPAPARELKVAIVADGVGGEVGGAFASTTAVIQVREYLEHNRARLTHDSLVRYIDIALHVANRAINETIADEPRLEGASTTIVIAAILENQLYLAHLGDSRAYLLRNRKLHQLTLDHTVAQEEFDRGAISAAQLANHAESGTITRWLGTDERLEIDHVILDPHQADAGHVRPNRRNVLKSFELAPGDRILLCTDGLSDYVSQTDITAIVAQNSPHRAVSKLINRANKGGYDNITSVIVSSPQGAIQPYALGTNIGTSGDYSNCICCTSK
ncbi:MAG: protein phosphatase 2C domain-containing protein [Caldilineaceae bacterium]